MTGAFLVHPSSNGLQARPHHGGRPNKARRRSCERSQSDRGGANRDIHLYIYTSSCMPCGDPHVSRESSVTGDVSCRVHARGRRCAYVFGTVTCFAVSVSLARVACRVGRFGDCGGRAEELWVSLSSEINICDLAATMIVTLVARASTLRRTRSGGARRAM